RCSWTTPRPTTRRCASERTSWGPWACSRSRPSSSASTSTGCSAGSRSRAGSSPAEGGRPVAAGTLYVVATPIGNLEDVTLRALRVLREVDLIAAEDTRRTRTLLERHGIARPLTSYYDAVERQRAPALIERLRAGAAVALVSDAGTPGIADPGYHLVRGALAAGIAVVPVPGPSALTALVSVAGFPAERFVFEGFLPSRPGPRAARLAALVREPRALLFFEAARRLAAFLAAAEAALGDRETAIARELPRAQAAAATSDPGDGDGREPVALRVRTQAPDELEAVDLRHAEIAEDHVGARLAEPVHRLLPVPGRDDARAEGLEQRPHGLSVVRGVVHHQDGRAFEHAAPSILLGGGGSPGRPRRLLPAARAGSERRPP